MNAEPFDPEAEVPPKAMRPEAVPPEADPAPAAGVPRVWAWTLLAALTVAQLLPVFLHTWLPMGDLGGHLDLMDVMARFERPETLYASTYVLPTAPNPNTVPLYLARWLPFLGAFAVSKLMIAWYFVGTPLALAFTARVFGRSPWLAVLALPLSWNAIVNVGFLNYLVAYPPLLASIGLARLSGETGKWRWMVALGVCLASLFFCHLIAFLIGLGMSIALVLAYLPRLRDAWRLVAIAPALPLLAQWMWRKLVEKEATESGRTFAQGGMNLEFLPFRELLARFPQWGMQYFRDRSDDVAFGLVCALWLVLLGVGLWQLRKTPRVRGVVAWLRAHGIEMLTICCLVAYFRLPSYMTAMEIITERVVVLVLFLFALWPQVQFRGRTRWLLAPMATLALGFPAVVHAHFSAFDRDELGGLPAALEKLPQRSRMAYVMWKHTNQLTFMGPLWHLPRAIFLLHSGGVTDDSFAVHAYTAVQFQKGQTPRRLPREFWRDPAMFDYHHVLLRSDDKPTEALRQGALELVFHEGQWWLFRVRGGGQPKADAALLGGPGGERAFAACPADAQLVGLDVRTGKFVEGVRPVCASANGRAKPTEWLGGGTLGQQPTRLRCPDGAAATGLVARGANLVDAVGLACGTTATELARGAGGSPLTQRCPDGQVAVGLRARAGALMDALGVMCAEPAKVP